MKDAKDWLAAVARQAAEQLDGETFAAACPLATRGYIRRAAAAARGLVFTKTLWNVINGERLPQTMVFGLTKTRLFVFELVTKTARAGDVKAIVPLDMITGVASVKFRFLMMIPRLNVDISIRNSDPLLLEAGWPNVDKAERFLSALTAAIANREP